jgi:hypothetical protein
VPYEARHIAIDEEPGLAPGFLSAPPSGGVFAARRRLVGLLLIDWSAEERGAFSRLARKFVAGMTRARDANRGKER